MHYVPRGRPLVHTVVIHLLPLCPVVIAVHRWDKRAVIVPLHKECIGAVPMTKRVTDTQRVPRVPVDIKCAERVAVVQCVTPLLITIVKHRAVPAAATQKSQKNRNVKKGLTVLMMNISHVLPGTDI